MSQDSTSQAPLPADLVQLVRAVTTNMRDLFLGLSRDGVVRYVSVNSERLIGYPQSELLGSSFFAYVYPEDVPLVAAMLERICSEETRLTSQVRLRAKDGAISSWELLGNSYDALDGEKRGFLVARDITDKLKAGIALADSERTIRRLYEIGASARTDVAGKIQAILQFGCERFALPSGVLLQSEADAFKVVDRFDAAHDESIAVSDETSALLAQTLCLQLPVVADRRSAISSRGRGGGHDAAAAADDVPSFLGAVVRVGSEPWGTLIFAGSSPRSTAFTSPDHDAISLMALLTGSQLERHEAEAALARLALTDPLTGLPNRRLLEDRISANLRMCSRFRTTCALLFVDLDYFKQVNDRYGHAAGDAALREVSQRLGTQLRGVDTLARIGGDEFVVFMPQTDAAGARVVADRMLDLLRQPLTLGPVKVEISASIGVSEYRGGGESSDTLIGRADAAMYSIKAAGRNGIGLSAR